MGGPFDNQRPMTRWELVPMLKVYEDRTNNLLRFV